MTLRIGIVGAGRSHQGLGPFMARMVHTAGHRVTAVVGRSEESAARAASELEEQLGGPARAEIEPFHDPRRLLDARTLDAWIIASPYSSHEAYLELAIDAAMPTLCEKPLVWPHPEHARPIWERFAAGGVLLRENVQWPYTLDAYRALYPEVELAIAKRLSFALAPDSDGRDRLIDSLSHVLSVLQEVHPEVESVEAVEIVRSGVDERALEVSFRAPTRSGRCDVTTHLARVDRPPRPASYGFDGRVAHRRIEPRDYSMRFESEDGRSVAVPDPMERLIVDFLDQVERGRRDADSRIPRRMEMLARIVAAYGQSSWGI